MNKYLSIPELRRKGEYYCSYQERCHAEVYKKLKTYTPSNTDINEVISKLIADDFLNETYDTITEDPCLEGSVIATGDAILTLAPS